MKFLLFLIIGLSISFISIWLGHITGENWFFGWMGALVTSYILNNHY